MKKMRKTLFKDRIKSRSVKEDFRNTQIKIKIFSLEKKTFRFCQKSENKMFFENKFLDVSTCIFSWLNYPNQNNKIFKFKQKLNSLIPL